MAQGSLDPALHSRTAAGARELARERRQWERASRAVNRVLERAGGPA